MTRKPHVILIHADQLRADCVGAYGNPDVQTPTLDALAADAMVHTAHYCACPVCTPSRYTLLSGLYPHQHRGCTNRSTLAVSAATFPKALRAAGYQTTAVGKMHCTPTYLDVGFDRMLLAEQDGPGRFEDDYHCFLMEQGEIDALDIMDQRSEYRSEAPQAYFDTFGVARSDLPEALHSTNWITEQALSVIDGWTDDTPQLLMVGYIKPHHPFDPPAPYDTLYAPQALTLLPGYTPTLSALDAERRGYFDYAPLDEETLRYVMAQYYGAITHMDAQIGRILDALRRKGLYDDSLILFTSDHGDYMGFHHLLLKGNILYDPLMRIPLMIKHPVGDGHAPGRTAALSDNSGVAAQVLSVCGVACPACTQPKSTQYAFAETYTTIGGQPAYGFMARSDAYKLLISPREGQAAQILMFDLTNDPLEMRDVSEDDARAAQLSQHLLALTNWLSGTLPASFLCEEEPLIAGKRPPAQAETQETMRRARALFEQKKARLYPEA